MNRNKTKPSHEPYRTPIELSISESSVPTNELGPNSQKGTSELWPSNWVCQLARDGGWSKSMAFCEQFFVAECTKRDTDFLTTRHLCWAPIGHCTLISSKTYTEISDEQTNRTKREKSTYSQTSRLENPKDFSQTITTKKMFLTVLLLYALLVVSNLTWLDLTEQDNLESHERPQPQIRWSQGLSSAWIRSGWFHTFLDC
jgi:hypothetical protein